jgi:3' terminal RNA ribose 2'-O-methyltransferase Hen1
VLLPVLDGDKHYWVSTDEITKLAAVAGDWLAGHPEREVIIRRYLRHQPALIRAAVAQLAGEDLPVSDLRAADDADADEACSGATDGGAADGHPAGVPARARLREARVAAVTAELKRAGARRVLDLGCGDGRLLAALLRHRQFEQIAGVDASAGVLARAGRRLRLAEMAPRQRARIQLFQGALTYRDDRLAGYDAAVFMEVIEHVDADRLGALEQAVLGAAAPALVLITTPNAEFNERYPALGPDGLRHPDHRFEWGRAQFRSWARAAAERNSYAVRFEPVGPQDPRLGPATQMAVLSRA